MCCKRHTHSHAAANALWRQYQKFVTQVARAWYHRYRRWVPSLDDVCQQAALAWWRALPYVDNHRTEAEIRRFLYKAICHELTSAFLRRQPQEEASITEVDSACDAETPEWWQQCVEWLERAFNTLSPRHQAALLQLLSGECTPSDSHVAHYAWRKFRKTTQKYLKD